MHGDELGEAKNTPKDRIRVQNSLDSLEKWSNMNRIKFNKGKCEVLYLERHSQMYRHKMGNNQEGCSIAVKHLGVLWTTSRTGANNVI